VKWVRTAACAAVPAPDELSMTIDLTGPVPQVLPTCDHCSRPDRLYRLIGTRLALCVACFAKQHG